MAVLTNRSRVPVEVFGEVGNTPKRWMLEPGQMTHSTFDCIAVRATQWGTIFETTAWKKLLRPEAVVYTFEENFLVDDLSLHCFPYEAIPPFPRGYETISEGMITVDLDPSFSLGQLAPALGPHDGEFYREDAPNADELAGGNYFNRRFGRFVRTGPYISVRVQLDAFFTIDEALLNQKITEWKKTIETVWNTPILPHGTDPSLHIEMDYSAELEHYSVFIPNTAIAAVSDFFGSGASYTYWPLNMTDKYPKKSAHEFGHFLGLQDEYLYDGELPHLASAINQFSAFAGKKWTYSAFSRALSAYSVNEHRAASRTLRISPLPVPAPSLMQDPFGGSVDINLINAIADHRVQPLTLTEEHVKVVLRKTNSHPMKEDI